MTKLNKPIRILVVDDSLAYCQLLTSIFGGASDMQVIGTANDGLEGIDLANRLKPDIITMDIHMPRMDGFEATRQIMSKQPCPIVMVSASFDKSQRNLTFEALRAGALSIINKPTLFAPPDMTEALISQVRLMSEVKVVRRWGQSNEVKVATKPLTPVSTSKPTITHRPRVVAIASSTGGPGLLAKILAELPANFPVPIIIVQHITPGFGVGLAEWLNQQTPLRVHVATAGSKLQMGEILIAPDDYHIVFNHLGAIALNQDPPLHGVRPAADYLLESVARYYGSRAVGIVLTGMGRDGAKGLLAMRQAGARTMAQDKTTSVVFGMPAVAIELGAAEQVLPGSRVAKAIKMLCMIE